MNELIKLAIALTNLAVEATEYLKRENGKPYQPNLPLTEIPAGERMDVQAVQSAAVAETLKPSEDLAQPVEEPKKTRKPRAPKPEAVVVAPPPPQTEEQAIADAAADRANDEAHQALSEQASYDKMMEITKQWVVLAKSDTPKDGKTQAMGWLKEMGAEKLTDLSHEQRLAWIAKMEGAIAAHK